MREVVPGDTKRSDDISGVFGGSRVGEGVATPLEVVCCRANLAATSLRTPSNARNSPVEPTEMALDMASRAGATVSATLSSWSPSASRNPISEITVGFDSQGCRGSQMSNRAGSVC